MTPSCSLSSAFRRRCETISTDQRVRLGLQAFEALPARTLAETLNAQIMAPDQFASLSPEQTSHLLSSNQWSAAILCRKPLLIVINPNHTSMRRESSLMHELSHVLLNHPMVQFSPGTGLPMRDQLHEAEATFLGGCLQIPRRGLLWALQMGWSVIQIANHFSSSESMVIFRLNVTGASKACSVDTRPSRNTHTV